MVSAQFSPRLASRQLQVLPSSMLHFLQLTSRTPHCVDFLPSSLVAPSWSPLLVLPVLSDFSTLRTPDLGLLLSSLYAHFLDDLIQFHDFKYHLHPGDSQTYNSSLDLFPEPQSPVSNCCLDAPTWSLIGCLELKCPKPNSWFSSSVLFPHIRKSVGSTPKIDPESTTPRYLTATSPIQATITSCLEYFRNFLIGLPASTLGPLPPILNRGQVIL